jgi:hypothetical protein
VFEGLTWRLLLVVRYGIPYQYRKYCFLLPI